MKKHLTIFAFSIFFIAQFGKVINFCACVINTYQQTKTLNCDCEKKLTATFNIETKQQTQHTHPTPPQLEELFYILNAVSYNAFYKANIISIWPIASAELLQTGFLHALFRPPLQ